VGDPCFKGMSSPRVNKIYSHIQLIIRMTPSLLGTYLSRLLVMYVVGIYVNGLTSAYRYSATRVEQFTILFKLEVLAERFLIYLN
jgi:hypothetical protein